MAEYEGTHEDSSIDLSGGCGCCCCCFCLCAAYKHMLTPCEEFFVVKEEKVSRDELFDVL